MKSCLIALFLLVSASIFAQDFYTDTDIPDVLRENANAVVRLDQKDIIIHSQRSMTIKEKRVVTVLNEYGLSALDAEAYYDKNRKIKKIHAVIYNSFGKEIKSIKKKDFRDVSVGDGFSIFSDNRQLYMDYTPVGYPFTMAFESEIETSNTAFVPSWSPVAGYLVSMEEAILNFTYPQELGFSSKEVNFADRYNIVKSETEGGLQYTAKSVPAMKYEEVSPAFTEFMPLVYFKVEKFNLEGVDGQAKTWEEFGKWYYDNLLTGTDELPVETQNKIKQLVGETKDPLEIAKIVYHYVQESTRYVSIQVGIGGFKPMLAQDVDRLGYGDCKALSNYTRALLKVVGVPSYYTIVNAGNYRKNMQEDFVSVQGNHIILAIPQNDQLVWLECTSQIHPFGFQGDFTDGRSVVMIKPEGGQLVKTKFFIEKDNSQLTKGTYAIDDSGTLAGSLEVVSKGTQYDDRFAYERFSATEKDNHYKKYFHNIHNLKLQKVQFKNDTDAIAFTQSIEISAASYASNSNGKLMFVLNAFNVFSAVPKRYRSRENPFEISRGFYDEDEIAIVLPAGYAIEAMPHNTEINSKFGEYSTQIIKESDHKLLYQRKLLIKDGIYDSTQYEEYRLFMEQIARNDNAKIVLTKKT